MEMPTKRCSACGLTLSTISFYRNKSTKDGLSAQCKICDKARQRVAYARNRMDPGTRAKSLDYQRERSFGVTPERYAEMLDEQGGVCALCGKPDSRQLSVDHDHRCCPGRTSCGECVRSLLCNPCNVLEGRMASDLGLTEKILNYMGLGMYELVS